MAQLGRFTHTAASSTTGLPVSGASVTIYREGATVNGDQSGTSPLTVTVRDLGKIEASDTVFVNTTTGTTYNVNSVSGRTSVVLSGFSGTLSLSDGDRIIPSSTKPTLYGDDQGGASTSNPLTTSATGLASCFIEGGAYDYIVSGGGLTSTLFSAMVAPTHTLGQIRYADEFAANSVTGGIAEAVADLPSTGGRVILSGNKTYTYTAAITISTPDVTVEGAGDSTLLQAGTGSGTHCFDVAAHRFTLRNCKIDGVNASKTVGRGVNIQTTYNDTTIENVTFLNTPDACVGENNVHARTRVINCKMTNPGDAGSTDAFCVIFGAGATFFRVTGCYFDCSTLSNSDAIFCTSGSTDGVIIGNHATSGGNNGYRFGTTRILVANNIATGFTTDGFRFDSTDGIIVGNIAQNCTGAGFKTDGCTNTSLIGNVSKGNGNGGILINNATTNSVGLSIKDNYCLSNTGVGIGISASSTALTKCTIVGNHCESNSFSGISITNGGGTTGTITDMLIANNYCKTNTLKGIYIAPNAAGANAWTNIYIANNSLIGNTEQGLVVDAHGTASTISVGSNYYQGNSADTSFTGTNWTFRFRQPLKLGTAIAAAATISIPTDGNVFHVTGATNVTNGITVNAWDNGRDVTLIFDSTPTVSDTGTSVLSTDFVATTNDTLSIVCDGTNWYQKGTSAN